MGAHLMGWEDDEHDHGMRVEDVTVPLRAGESMEKFRRAVQNAQSSADRVLGAIRGTPDDRIPDKILGDAPAVGKRLGIRQALEHLPPQTRGPVLAVVQRILAETGEALNQCVECKRFRLNGEPPTMHEPGCKIGRETIWRN